MSPRRAAEAIKADQRARVERQPRHPAQDRVRLPRRDVRVLTEPLQETIARFAP
jgi:hypothetical protein